MRTATSSLSDYQAIFATEKEAPLKRKTISEILPVYSLAHL
jgi:hypothetical protein